MGSVRNLNYVPFLEKEGFFTEPIPKPEVPADKDILWYTYLKPYERLYYHQTLNNIRKNSRYRQHLVPKDYLDLMLQSRYSHSAETFPDKVDMVLQSETVGEKCFKVLKNRKMLRPPVVEILGHPLIIGGTTEKMSPHSVKLINSGHHTQLTNNGYSRQSADGNFFHY